MNPQSAENSADAPAPQCETQRGIPSSRRQRDRLAEGARARVAIASAVPPLTLAELEAHARAVVAEAGLDESYVPYAAVLVHNEAWRDALSAVPFDRRLLLLPQCLRDADACPAVFDGLGLLCRRCGRCAIDELLAEAERLGYVALVSEGTGAVTAMIESGQIEAFVGASCLSSLQEIFPRIEAVGVPGVAIPLLRDGCRNTALDPGRLLEAMRPRRDGLPRPPVIEPIRREVEGWFTPAGLDELLGPARDTTERIARDWLLRAGKRWRPVLCVCAARALAGDDPPALRQIAVAVECFHKASLVHDDIEDGDDHRYGDLTLHCRYGVPVALNVGDLLLSEGYRLLAEAPLPEAARARMLRAAAEGHRQLCIGQGAELCWTRSPGPISLDELLDIYTGKTAPAFEVALRLGAQAAGADEELCALFRDYSRALGIAYQLRDDLSDASDGDLPARRPSILLALACEQSAGAMPDSWNFAARTDLRDRARALLDDFRNRSVAALAPLRNTALKGLLRRVVAGIFDAPDGKGNIA